MSNVHNRKKSSLKAADGKTRKSSMFQKVRFAVDDVIFSRSTRDQKIQRIEQMSTWPYVILFIAFLTFSISLVDYLHSDDSVIASSHEEYSSLFLEVPCSKDYDKRFKECFPKICGRGIHDNLFDDNELTAMKNIANKGMKYGGGSGGATILDLHSGALSYQDKFINIFKVSETIFTSSDFQTYTKVKNKILSAIANRFQVDKRKLYLTKPTFFSRLTNQSAVTKHDEYWHPHVDRKTYGTFYYTSLLYLSDYDDDFTGGRFIFMNSEHVNKSVEPRTGRLSFFTSGSENEHFVERVESGTRYAVTVSFTCDKQHSIKDPYFM